MWLSKSPPALAGLKAGFGPGLVNTQVVDYAWARETGSRRKVVGPSSCQAAGRGNPREQNLSCIEFAGRSVFSHSSFGPDREPPILLPVYASGG